MKKEPIKNTTRGGQVILHNLRMIAQVVQKVVVWLLPVGLAVIVAWFVLTTSADTRLIGKQWLSAQFHLFFNNSHYRQPFVFPDGQVIVTTAGQIVAAPFVQAAITVAGQFSPQSFGRINGMDFECSRRFDLAQTAW